MQCGKCLSVSRSGRCASGPRVYGEDGPRAPGRCREEGRRSRARSASESASAGFSSPTAAAVRVVWAPAGARPAAMLRRACKCPSKTRLPDAVRETQVILRESVRMGDALFFITTNPASLRSLRCLESVESLTSMVSRMTAKSSRSTERRRPQIRRRNGAWIISLKVPSEAMAQVVSDGGDEQPDEPGHHDESRHS